MMATKPKAHNKVVLKVGYKQYIVDAGAAFAFMSAIADCEEYNQEWDAERKVNVPTISPLDDMSTFSICGLTPEHYALGKLVYKSKQLKEEQQA